MMTAPAHALPLPDTMRSFVAIVSNEATAAHDHASALGRLDGALAQSRRFAANAAHELRTPLSAVSTELELLAEIRDLLARRDETPPVR